MRTTVIPAQITTVEDKIAGNLNLTQILILLIPVFWTTVVYAFFAPGVKLVWYKFPLILAVLFICLALAIRLKGKVALEWLMVLLKYRLRPKYYLFDKNSPYLRPRDLPVFEKKPVFNKPKVSKIEARPPAGDFPPGEIIKLDNLLVQHNYTLSYKAGRRGGIRVALEKIPK